MRTNGLLYAILTAAALLAASCAVTPAEETYYSQDRVMKAWIQHNHPGVTSFGDTGLYILEMSGGNGPAVADSSYIWVHYTKYTLDGSVISTNIKELSEQTGSHSATSYYGSRIWRMDQGFLPEKLETVLKTMRSGGRLKVALPASASYHNTAAYSAFSSISEDQNEIIEITLDTVVNNIYDYQEQAMRNWFREHYNVADTAAEHLYLKKLVEQSNPGDTISEGRSINVKYIGRLMNGQVFDTNIEDTAKFYRIWESGKTYSDLSIVYYKENEELAESENSVIAGFRKALQLMNYGETAVTLFSSQLAYGDNGKDPSIPEYAPLFFWLSIEPQD